MLILRRSLALSATIAALVLLAACARAGGRASPPTAQPSGAPVGVAGESVASITSGGVVRQYRLHIPPGYQQGRPLPAVAFHGTADNLLPYEGKPPLLQPVHAWAAGWAAHNSCASASTVTFQRGDVVGEAWGHCRDGADVTLYTIAGKGHSWPGSAMPAQITTRDIDATDVIWEFFAAHPKP